MLITIIAFVIVLSILVLVHELGHFLTAKKFGIKVEEFGFGFPPRVFGKKIGETLYSINALPLGGFVRLHGEVGADKVTKPKRAFVKKSKKVRAVIASGGIVGNFLLAIVAFGVFYSFVGFPRETTRVEVLEVSEGSPAQEAGILPGDIVLKVNNEDIDSNDEFISMVNENGGEKTKIVLERSIAAQVEEVS